MDVSDILPGADVSGIGGITLGASVTGRVLACVVGFGLGLVFGLTVIGLPSPSQFIRKLGGVP